MQHDWIRPRGNQMSIDEKLFKIFDLSGELRREIDETLVKLAEFKKLYPFHEDPKEIDKLSLEKVYWKGHVEEGYFLHWLEFRLAPLGKVTTYGPIGQNILDHFADFKQLLKIAVSRKPLSEKIDAPWESIPLMGGGKLYAKKIISCYDNNMLPIFSLEDAKLYFEKIIGKDHYRPDFDDLSEGKKHEFISNSLLEVKANNPITRSWNIYYFMRFLAEMYKNNTLLPEKSELGMMFEPRTHEEMIFLFGKYHTKLGFPRIYTVRSNYPDILAFDDSGTLKRIEVEPVASKFNHLKKNEASTCDYIFCWENDMEKVPANWPPIIALKERLKKMA